jgi:hypothetical protein
MKIDVIEMIFKKKLEFKLCFKEFKLSLCYFGGFVGNSIIRTSFILVKWLVFFCCRCLIISRLGWFVDFSCALSS